MSSPSTRSARSGPSAAPVGVLLAQLGTPDAPTTEAVRRYLKEFLSDRRVVDIPRIVWWPLLNGIILRTRPKKSAALYRKVWTDGGSPLLLYSREQQRAVAERLGDEYVVELGMTYGEPKIGSAMDRLVAGGCERIVVLPLYPQYSTATTASVSDRVDAWKAANAEVEIVFIDSFPDHPLFIEALRRTVVEAGAEPTKDAPLLMSYHGIPQRYAKRGDPYPQECERTSRALADALGLPDDAWRIVYQSRFGPEAWLQPYADETVEALPDEGITAMAVISPSFVADCLETIDELGRELRESFLESGGREFTRVPCVNGSSAAADAFAQIVREAGA